MWLDWFEPTYAKDHINLLTLQIVFKTLIKTVWLHEQALLFIGYVHKIWLHREADLQRSFDVYREFQKHLSN